MRRRRLQDIIHWLEAGQGARWLAVAALITAAVVISAILGHKRFQGPRSEVVLLQADVGRQIAAGNGFSTRALYPQSAAWLESRGEAVAGRDSFPELYSAPLYPLLIGATLAGLPASWSERLLRSAASPPAGFGGDYLLLGLNLALLWATAGLTFLLARRLFGARAGWLAAAGVFLSVGLWEQALEVTGGLLISVLLLGSFVLLLRLEEHAEAGHLRFRTVALPALAAGVLGGLLFLSEYTAGLAAAAIAVYCFSRRRWMTAACIVAGMAFVTAPWIVRNLALTGSPVALAWQEVALRVGDPTAEPSVQRRHFSATLPTQEVRKIANKGLAGIEANFREKFWSAGAGLFAALFAVGLLYGFRSPAVNRLRWLAAGIWLLLLTAHPFLNSGESARIPAAYLAPLAIVFGTGFFLVLVESDRVRSAAWRAAAGALVLFHALPLAHDLLEPRRTHFSYPPYYPSLFIHLEGTLYAQFRPGFELMTDIPAGLAWYGGRRVWAQPHRLRDFYVINQREEIGGLLLTPDTLDRPYFSELARPPSASDATADTWGEVYAGLATGRLPPRFPLSTRQSFGENMLLLLNPFALPRRE